MDGSSHIQNFQNFAENRQHYHKSHLVCEQPLVHHSNAFACSAEAFPARDLKKPIVTF